MVTIKQIKTDKCEASGKQSEGVVCEFQNGMFSGFLSWNEFKKLCRMILKKADK